MLELAILGLLLESPMHGYELRKRLTGLLGAFRAFSYGSLYPALRRMQLDSLIVEDVNTCRRTLGSSRPSGLPADRRGQERFSALVADTVPQNYTDDGFGVHLAFFTATPAQARLRILEGRRRQVEERREELRRALAGPAGTETYTRQLHELGLETTEREVRWLNELIAAGSPAKPTKPTGQPTRRRKKRVTVTIRTRSGCDRRRRQLCLVNWSRAVQYYLDVEDNAKVPGLMMSSSAGTTFAMSSSSPRSTWTARRWASTSPTRSRVEERHHQDRRRPPTNVDRAARTHAGRARQALPETIENPPSRASTSSRPSDAKVDVMGSYLPVDSEEADKFFAQCAIDAGVAFVNALPCSSPRPGVAEEVPRRGRADRRRRHQEPGRRHITHRVMAKLRGTGLQLDRTIQLNVGGNMDFPNMLERARLKSKKISKTQAVTTNLQKEADGKTWTSARRITSTGSTTGSGRTSASRVARSATCANLEYKLEVWDSPNSAGVIIDAVRAAKIAKDRGIGGPVIPASAYLMKSPPEQIADDKARAQLEEFIEG